MTFFPYPPGDPDGIWTVDLPPDAGIGELIVYNTAPAPVVPVADWYWPFDDSGAYYTDIIAGSTFTSHTSVTTGQTSLRDDAAGFSVLIPTGSAVATPSPALGFTAGFTFAVLIKVGSTAFNCQVGLLNTIGTISYGQIYANPTTGVIAANVPTGLINSSSLIATAGTTQFWAMRVAASGLVTVWLDTVKEDVTTTTAPGTTAPNLRVVANSVAVNADELLVFTSELTDADVMVLRAFMLGT
jgi:hypothetical protein